MYIYSHEILTDNYNILLPWKDSEVFRAKTKKDYFPPSFLICSFRSLVSRLTQHVILLPLQVDLKVFKTKVAFASKQFDIIREQKKMYCVVAKEVPWERIKMNSGMTVLLNIKRPAPPGHSVSFFVCTVAWSILGSRSIQGILFDSSQLNKRIKWDSFDFH